MLSYFATKPYSLSENNSRAHVNYVLAYDLIVQVVFIIDFLLILELFRLNIDWNSKKFMFLQFVCSCKP